MYNFTKVEISCSVEHAKMFYKPGAQCIDLSVFRVAECFRQLDEAKHHVGEL